MDRRKDVAVAAAITLLGLVIAVLGTQINLGRIRDPIGSRAVPVALGLLIMAGGLFLAGRRLVRWRTEPTVVPPEGTTDEPDVPAHTPRAMAVWAICFGYVLLLDTLGFVILTPVLLLALLWIMGVRAPLRLAAITVLGMAVGYGVFGLMLGVRLPLGPLDPYLGNLG